MSHRALVLCGLVGCLLTPGLVACGSSQQVVTETRSPDQQAVEPWLQVSTALVMVDTVEIRSSDSFFDDSIEPAPVDDVSPGVGFSVGYRLRLAPGTLGYDGVVQTGLMVEHLQSGLYSRVAESAQLGSQTSIFMELEPWFFESPWGAFFTNTGLGWTGSYLSRELEFDIENSGVAGDIGRLQHGLLFTLGTGLALHPTDHLHVRVGVAIRLSSPRIDGEANNPQFVRTRLLVNAGVEWRP